MRALYALIVYLLSSKVGFNTAAAVDLNEILHKILRELDDVKKQLNSNEVVLKTLQSHNSNQVTFTCFIDDIAHAIRTRQFSTAERHLTDLVDKSKVHQIIKLVYLGSSVNMNIIIDFAKNLTNAETKFQVLNALHDEMREDSDPIQFITLVEAMEGELAKEGNITSDIKAKTQNVIHTAIEGIKDVFLNISRTALGNGKYQKDVNIESLATAIFNFRPDVFNDAMAEIVDGAFEDGVKVEKILKTVSSHRNISQVIAELEAISNKLRSTTDVYNKSALDFALHLRDLQQREDFNSTRQDLKDKVNGIIEQLPTCAKSIYFYPSVCFWSNGRQEYLYAASSANSYDERRRTIYTSQLGNTLPGAVWYVEKIDGYYYFKNANYANEYLYPFHGGTYFEDMRNIFTWIPGYNKEYQSRWVVELDGSYCYIKSAFNNEYMFASGVKYNECNSYVYTRKGLTKVESAEYQWQLRNCDPVSVG